MTINKVIAQLDELRPNAVSAEVKAAWTAALDGMLRRELLSLEPRSYEFPADADTELSVAAPYEGVYYLYASAMLDLLGGETARYANSMAAFETLLDGYRRQEAKGFSASDAGFRNVRL